MIDLNTLQLAKGSHEGGPPPGDPNCEMCLFEAYNALNTPPDDADQLTDDCPDDVSYVLHRFGMRLNDMLPDDKRQQLKQYLPRDGQPSPLAGTRGDGLDEVRRWMATDWAVRTATPRWLDLAGLTEQATRLRQLAPITDQASHEVARPVVRAVRQEVWQFRQERFAALRAEVKAKYADAGAGAAADAVAVAGAVAGAVADAAADAAADAVADAGADAGAGDSYSATYRKVYDAVYPTIKARYQPVVDELHDQAVALYGRMIRPIPPELEVAAP